MLSIAVWARPGGWLHAETTHPPRAYWAWEAARAASPTPRLQKGNDHDQVWFFARGRALDSAHFQRWRRPRGAPHHLGSFIRRGRGEPSSHRPGQGGDVSRRHAQAL